MACAKRKKLLRGPFQGFLQVILGISIHFRQHRLYYCILASWIVYPALNDNFKRDIGILSKESATAAVFVPPKYVETEIDKMPEIAEEDEE